MTSKHITPFITGLRSRNDESRLATAYELYRYVNTDVPEMPLDDQNAFIDEINHNVFEMVSSSEVHEKKGGILAIGEYNCFSALVLLFPNFLLRYLSKIFFIYLYE